MDPRSIWGCRGEWGGGPGLSHLWMAEDWGSHQPPEPPWTDTPPSARLPLEHSHLERIVATLRFFLLQKHHPKQ